MAGNSKAGVFKLNSICQFTENRCHFINLISFPLNPFEVLTSKKFMTLKLIPICLVLTGIIFLFSCNKNNGTVFNPCANTHYNITHSKTESIGSLNNGTITISSPQSDTLSYQLNNGSFQSSWYFTGLAPGNYVVTIRNQKGCTDTTQVTILNYGPKFAAVKQLVLGYCGPCHLGGTVNGGMNFDTDASIVANKARIKIRAVDGLPSFMPEAPNSPLSAADKQKITDWINAGGTILN